MEMSFGSRLKHAWNAFTGNVQMNYRDLGMSHSYRADRPRMSRGNEKMCIRDRLWNVNNTLVQKSNQTKNIMWVKWMRCLSPDSFVPRTRRKCCMIFNNHSNLEGQHAFLGASKYHWINYDETKVADAYSKFLATQRGTVLHDFACQCITLGQRCV